MPPPTKGRSEAASASYLAGVFQARCQPTLTRAPEKCDGGKSKIRARRAAVRADPRAAAVTLGASASRRLNLKHRDALLTPFVSLRTVSRTF